MQRIQYDRYGGPEVMKLDTFVAARPDRNEVQVEVYAAAVNPIDWKVRSGAMKFITGRSFPRAMGYDFAGIVQIVGPGVTRFSVGDSVFGLAPFKRAGAFADVVVASSDALAKKPSGLSFAEAACLPTPGVTAWNGLVDKGALTEGSTVFINGCGGAVGEAAVRIATALGARVSGSCGADAIERARSLGVRQVVDYRRVDVTGLSGRFDIVYDAAGVLSTRSGLGMLAPGGRFCTVEPTPSRFLRALWDRRMKPIVATPRPELLDALAGLAEQGKLALPIAADVPLSGAIDLIAGLEAGRRLQGKGVILVK